MSYGIAFGNERSSVCGYHAHVDIGGCVQLGKPCCVCDDGYVGTPDQGCIAVGAAAAGAAVAAAAGCRAMGGRPTAAGDCVMPGEAPARPGECPACPVAKPCAPCLSLTRANSFSWSAFAIGAILGAAGGMVAAKYVARRGARP